MSLSTDVFRTMTPEECTTFFTSLRDELKPLYRQAEVVSASVLRVRPVYLGKQPFPKRIEMMRKALALRINAEASGELLAAFILEKHAAALGELLDLFKLEHEDGALKGNAPPEPDAKVVKSAVEKFTKGENPPLRSVILKAFAGQPAIEWPTLDALVFGTAPATPAASPVKYAMAPPPSAPKAIPAPKTTVKAAPAKPEAKPAPKAVAKPAAKPAGKAAVKPAVKPAVKAAAKTVKPAAKSAAKKPSKSKGKGS